MLDFTDFKKRIRDYLLADIGVTTLVSTRMYYGDLATLVNPIYPCVNLDVFEGRSLIAPVDRLRVTVYCSSKVSYHQADAIFDAVNSALNNATIGGKMTCRLHITPINRVLQTNMVYQNISRYDIFYIN